MSNQQNNQAVSKAAYVKPALTEYGSLAERTKMIGFQEPDEADPDRHHSHGGGFITSFIL